MKMTERETGSVGWSAMGLILALVMTAGVAAFSDHDGPFPVTIFILAPLLFFNSVIGVSVVLLLVALVYFGWVRPAFTGRAQFTKWTWALFAGLVLLSILYYSDNWAYGVRHQGRAYTLGCFVVGAMFVVSVVVT